MSRKKSSPKSTEIQNSQDIQQDNPQVPPEMSENPEKTEKPEIDADFSAFGIDDPECSSIMIAEENPLGESGKGGDAGKHRLVLMGKPRQEKVFHFILAFAAIIIIIAGIKTASEIIAPVLLALFVTIILLVPLRWLRSKGCPNAISLLLVLGFSGSLFLVLVFFIAGSVNDFLKSVPAYKREIERKIDSLDKQLVRYGIDLGLQKDEENKTPVEEQPENLDPNESADGNTDKNENDNEKSNGNKNIPQLEVKPAPQPVPVTEKPASEFVPGQVGDEGEGEKIGGDDGEEDEKDAEGDDLHGGEEIEISDDFALAQAEIEKLFQPDFKSKPSLIALNVNTVMYWASRSLLELKHLLQSGFLFMIFTLFMIFEAARFPEKIDAAFGKEGPINNSHFRHIALEIRRYLFLKAISSLLSASAAGLVYVLFGVPSPLFWTFIAFFLYFIPNIGGIIASIIPGMLIFMMYDIQGVMLYVVCLVTIECMIGYGIEPKILGHGLGISTVVILFSLISWGWILGPVGLFLAAPLTIMLKIILQAFKETSWIAILLGDKPRELNKP